MDCRRRVRTPGYIWGTLPCSILERCGRMSPAARGAQSRHEVDCAPREVRRMPLSSAPTGQRPP
eukprot:3425332-Prymnesium_polylepis.1